MTALRALVAVQLAALLLAAVATVAHFYGMLPGFGVFAALALRRAFGERVLTSGAAAVTVLLLVLWAHLATVTPATV